MELNSSVNTFIGGMNMDSDISLLKENQYTYAENIRLLANEDSTTGVLQNRDCLKKFESQLKEGETILGTVVTRVFRINKSIECIVVITLYNDINNIYIVNINNELQWELFLSAGLGWTSDLKIIANYESDTVSKIYIADEKRQLKAINLNKSYDKAAQYDQYSFDITPVAILPPPDFVKLTKGNLEVGSVQYAYQLFSKNGAESPISSVSELIYIPRKHNQGVSTNTEGGNIGDISDNGCQIRITIKQSVEFDMIRIYRIHYTKNNSIPNVFIIQETDIIDDEILYQDTQNNLVSSITVDEFNALVLQAFVPKTIEKHDNRLFAANILHNDWDVDYDTRAYRCDINGNIQLTHGDITQNIYGKLLKDGTIDGNSVPEKHDCINPSNQLLFEEDSFKYVYGYDEFGQLIYGGTGPNISYEFCYTRLNLSDSPPKNSNEALEQFTTVSDSIELRNEGLLKSQIHVLSDSGDILHSIPVPDTGILRNYSDSYFTSKCLGYQRDEIYRFGIVFYNNKHQKTPVHWIGDIRMPCQRMVGTDRNSKILPFHFNEPLEVDGSEVKLSELVGYALGVSFKINNKDKLKEQGVVAYEIVRCARTELDRTIVTQGITSSLVKFDYWGEDKDYMGNADIRPMALFNMGSRYSTQSNNEGVHHYWNDSPTVEKDIPTTYIEFVSPEIVISGESVVDNIVNGKLCRLYWSSTFTTTMSEYYITEDNTTEQYAQHNYNWAIPQTIVHTNIPDHPHGTSNPSCGTLKLSEDPREGYEDYLYLLYFNHFINSSDDRGRYGNALIEKYYDNFYDGNSIIIESHSIDDAIVSRLLPFIHNDEEAKSYAQPIGNRLYVNTTVASKNILSNHGRNAILKMSNTFNTTSSFFDSFLPVISKHGQMNTAAIVNIKQHSSMYGGEWYVNRINSTYISCDAYLNIDVDQDNLCVFGGDTYIGVFDYAHTTMRQMSNDPTKDTEKTLFVNCYIPLESTINLNLLNDTFSKTIVDGVGQNLIQYEPTVTQNYVQSNPLYEYNSAYSADGNAQIFVQELLYTDENPIYETRITCSELKTNNEIIDSWTKFKFANYLDVDNSYGKITNLKSFNGKLLFWQDSSVGVAAVNERSLIQDNNISALTLGTGGILVRYDYHTTLNGSSVCNDRSICNSTSTLYWYDQSKNEICAINNTVMELSKVKGVKSWTNKLDKHDALGWYDWKYNEVLFQHPSDEKERSLVFNEQLNVFTSFYDYPVSHVAQMTDKLVTLDSFGNLYLHGVEENYEPFISNIKYVINKGYPETKVYDNVWFDALFEKNELVKSVVFKTKTQETKPISYKDIENREDTYRFPIPRDKNGVARMRGKYLICDYTFDCINDGDFKIPYIKTTFRISRV